MPNVINESVNKEVLKVFFVKWKTVVVRLRFNGDTLGDTRSLQFVRSNLIL